MVAITETWANSAHVESELSFYGYESFYKNRKHKEGGVFYYVNCTLPAIKIDKQDAKNYNSVYVKITANNKKLTLATVYRPPKQQAADDTTALYEEIHSLTQSNEAIIIGDFNCPNIDRGLSTEDHEGNRLIEIVEDLFLTQVVTQPTRENNLLESVLVSDPDLIRNCEVGEKINGCDHHLIRFNVNVSHKLKENPSVISDYKKANFNLARELLPSATWDQLNLTDNTIDNVWNDFKDKLLGVEKATVPTKPRRVNGAVDPSWMTREINRAVNLKKKIIT